MNDSAKRAAEQRTAEALAEAGVEDFRDTYRDRLRWLKDNRPAAFTEALSHFNDVLVPNIAAGADPIREWIDYGKRLSELSGRGSLVAIDETGRAEPMGEEIVGLLLHLPDDTTVPALALAVPRALSDAQRATLQLLVKQ